MEDHYPSAAKDDAPIFLNAEPARKNHAKLVRMTWETARKTIKEVIKKVNEAFPGRERIVPDDMFPDIYEVVRPYQGDVLKRNFEYSCVDYTRMKGAS